jgi:hypothetical protein
MNAYAESKPNTAARVSTICTLLVAGWFLVATTSIAVESPSSASYAPRSSEAA